MLITIKDTKVEKISPGKLYRLPDNTIVKALRITTNLMRRGNILIEVFAKPVQEATATSEYAIVALLACQILEIFNPVSPYSMSV